MAVDRRSVRVRLTMSAVLVVGVGLIAGASVVLTLVWQNLTTNAETEARQRAQDVVALLADGTVPPTLPAFVQIVSADGEPLASSPELRDEKPLLAQRPSDGAVVGGVNLPSGADGTDYAVAGLPATVDGQSAAVYAAVSLDHAAEGVEATATALTIAVPVLLALVAGTSWLLVGRALRPVEAIRAQVAEITASELDRRVPEPPSGDEVGRLARTMNQMLARLQDAHDHQRRFVADAAHELRSPLATVQARLEVGLAHPEDTDWRVLAQEVHREGSRLNHLVDELLVLSRTDNGNGVREAVDRVDLDELVLAEIEAIRSRGRVAVDLSSFSAARLRGRPDELSRLVRNLLDNAERHAASTVTVSLVTTTRFTELVVADDGSGIPPASREQVFERFLRLQPARDRDSGGAGLGLAIVRDVAEGHGGRAWVADAAVGAELHVRLPLSFRHSSERREAARAGETEEDLHRRDLE